MRETRSAATADVAAALADWRATKRPRRYTRLAVAEVLDRTAANHRYLAVTFAHRGDWSGAHVKPIADSFLTWLMQVRPDLGGPHLAFLKVRSDLEEDDPAGTPPRPPESDSDFARLRRHATEFAVAWLDRIPATHNICIDDREPGDLDPLDGVRVVEKQTSAAELQLRAPDIARVLARRYDEAHPDLAWKVDWIHDDWSDGSGSTGAPRPAALPARSPGLGLAATPADRHAHARAFAEAWLRLIPFVHPIYIAEPFDSDLHPRITVRVVRDDIDSEHTLDEVAVAQALGDRYGRVYPDESSWVQWLGEYCK